MINIPIPRAAPNHSPIIAPIKAAGHERRNPLTIAGAEQGKLRLQNCLIRLAPKIVKRSSCSLEALDKDRSFLTAGGVFTDDMINGYIELKMEEVNRFRMTTHPIEFDMYYSL